MWYVMQVRTGKEEETVLLCEKVIPRKILAKGFLPYYKTMKKYEGQWHVETRILFPGYVFLVSDSAEQLFLALKKIPTLTKLLGTGTEVLPLTGDEIAFLKQFGKDEQVVEMSVGIIEDGQLQIMEGPLKGHEKLVKRIDRHKRKAYLEVELCGKMVETEVGLEIVGKS